MESKVKEVEGFLAAGGIGRGIFEGEVFERVLGLLDDSTLYDTLQALCENQIINAACFGMLG